MAWQRVSGIWGSRQRIQRQLQLGELTTEQVQSLSSLTIQQLASMSRVVTNSTFSLALVFSVSAGSGKAFPTDSCFTPLRQQTLSTLTVLSVLREQVALVRSQLRSKQQGMVACSYHPPRYLAISTQGTVLGGSLEILEAGARSPRTAGAKWKRARAANTVAARTIALLMIYCVMVEQKTGQIQCTDGKSIGKVYYKPKNTILGLVRPLEARRPP